MNILAVTACATGVAHTFMAAKALEIAAKELGHRIKVEKQGASGIENRITDTDLGIGEIVILAVDTRVKDAERFEGKIVYEVGVSAPIKNAKKVINDAIEKLK